MIKKYIPSFVLNFYHLFLSFLGAIFFGFPSKRIKVIGVTGTKGKSTTVILAGKILEEAGYKVAWISSVSFKIGEKEWPNDTHLTMPGRFFIQKFLRKAVKENCNYFLIEVTSEGIKQHRHRFIDFSTAVFTNLSPEHIEAHGSFEKYREAKGKLFQKTKKLHILNIDNENVYYYLNFWADKKYLYFIENNDKQSILSGKKIKLNCNSYYSVFARNARVEKDFCYFEIDDLSFIVKLLGFFNIYNCLAAIAIAKSENVDISICKRALEKVDKIEGRMEEVTGIKGFKVFVDFAHTPDSFKEVFKIAKKIANNRIISVFGATGGGRDKWKRPEMGKIAAQYSDIVILTNDDPYYDNQEEIVNEIEKGVLLAKIPDQNNFKLYKILDRREAIRKAIFLSKEGDVVLILGRGSEKTMVVDGKTIPCDDVEIVKNEYEKIRITRT
jgi:UDP-N-acetylmuramoyl-L-alanyl-D-glutamate--2,6-diaminopimelate ligase